MKQMFAMGRKFAIIIVVGMALSVMSSCRQSQSGGAVVEADDTMAELMQEAQLLHLVDCGDYIRASVVNPWDTTRLLADYVLVERGVGPDSLPHDDVVRVDVPLTHSLVYSSVHAGIIDELGCGNAIAGVADGDYFTREPFAARIRRGEVVNVGSSMSPSVEKIVGLSPDAILVSPFENAGHGAIDQLNIPIIECADYMESTPKGRAEWVKLFGVLFGARTQADSVYDAVKCSYDSIASVVAKTDNRPIVLTEMLTDGYWYVPGGKSYMAALLRDAGGNYPWANDANAGSLQLDFSSVYAKAADADVWLIRSFGHDITLDDLRSVYLLNSQFKAFKDGNVFVANTAEVPLFEDFPFHPERLLLEYAKIFHPNVMDGELHYYKRAK